MIYFDNAATTPCLPEAWKAMEVAYKTYGSVHRSQHPYSTATTDAYENARKQVADFIGAESDQITFTSGTSDSIRKVAWSIDVGPGDEVVVTAFDHNSNYLPWKGLCARTGAKLTVLRQDILNEVAFNNAVKIVAFPHVCNVDGSILDVEYIAEVAREVEAVTVLDCAQSVGTLPINIDWDVDYLAFSGHKLGGPTGVGVLYDRQGISDIHGTPPVIQAIGLGEACGYCGSLPFMQERDFNLRNYLIGKFSKLDGLTVVQNPHFSHAKSVAFTVDGFHPHDVAHELGRRGICIRGGRHCNDLFHDAIGIPATCRVSFSPSNTLDEIDTFIDALQDLQQKGLFSGVFHDV